MSAPPCRPQNPPSRDAVETCWPCAKMSWAPVPHLLSDRRGALRVPTFVKCRRWFPHHPGAKSVPVPQQPCPSPHRCHISSPARLLSVSPGGWKLRLPARMPPVPHPPSSGASTSVTRTPSAAASFPLRGPRKPAAIKQVGTGQAGPCSPLWRFWQVSRAPQGTPSPQAAVQTLQFRREKRGRPGPPSKGGNDTAQGSRHSLQHRLGYWSPDSNPPFTAGPDSASPDDWFLPSVGETTDLPTSDPTFFHSFC